LAHAENKLAADQIYLRLPMPKYGVTGGPHSNHYRKWLLSGPAFLKRIRWWRSAPRRCQSHQLESLFQNYRI